MSKRIHYGKKTPLSFRESLSFNAEAPYLIRYKEFESDDIAPPHYIDALELLVGLGVTGVVTMEGRRFALEGDASAIAIPPGTVHSVQINKGPGHVYVLHISLAELARVIHMDRLLEQSGKQLANLSPVCVQPMEIHALVEALIEHDGAPLARMRILLAIFEKLEPQMKPGDIPMVAQSLELQNIIRWTEENFREHISLGLAAASAGFSRNYFCAWFKAQTGMTYVNYVNRLRVDYACRLLERGEPISSACFACGFKDYSYFIQVFKRMQGCTPKHYLGGG